MNRYRIFFMMYMLSIFFIHPMNLLAHQSSKDSLSQIEKEYEFLKEMAINIKKETVEEKKEFKNDISEMIRFGVWIVGAAFAVVSILFGVFGYKSLREIKKNIEERAVTQADQILTNKFSQLVGENVSHLQHQIDIVQSYQNSKLLFIGNHEKLKAWQAFEIKILQQSGLTKIATSDNIQQSFLDVDILIYQYQPSANQVDNQLIEVIKTAQNRTQSLPIIIETGNQRIDETSKKMLEDYRWYIFSNMPLTLLSHIYNASKIFFTHHK